VGEAVGWVFNPPSVRGNHAPYGIIIESFIVVIQTQIRGLQLMLVSNLEELSAFLSDWYATRDLSIPDEMLPTDNIGAIPLVKAWLKLGLLSVGYEQWLQTGTASPLACQDGLTGPGHLARRNGFVHVVSENQGNWTMCYREEDQAVDPEVFSDFLEQEIGGTGYVSVGCKLSKLIITSILAETVFFGSVPNENAKALEVECDRHVWTGRYYNAVGFGSKYEKPSHQFRTNSENDMLALYWNNEFSGFLARANIGQRNFARF